MAEGLPAAGEQVLVARVATRLIGLRAAAVTRVLPMLPLWRPPTAPAPLAGFVPIAGDPLPVLSARCLLGLGGEDEAPSVYAHILCLDRLGGAPAGLLVDRAEGFAAPSTFGTLEEIGSLNGCAVALFAHRAAMAHLIAPERLLARAEADALATLTAEAARRRAEWQSAA